MLPQNCADGNAERFFEALYHTRKRALRQQKSTTVGAESMRHDAINTYPPVLHLLGSPNEPWNKDVPLRQRNPLHFEEKRHIITLAKKKRGLP
jgi:hypothetical protein